MPSKEEKKQRKALVRTIEQKERAEAEATMPISYQDVWNLFDWLDEKVGDEGCHRDFRHTLEFLKQKGHSPEKVIKWLQGYHAYCDCEVFNLEDSWGEEAY